MPHAMQFTLITICALHAPLARFVLLCATMSHAIFHATQLINKIVNYGMTVISPTMGVEH